MTRSPGRVETVTRSPGRVEVRTSSPGRITQIRSSPAREHASHYSPYRLTHHSPHRHTEHSPNRYTHVHPHLSSSPRASSPIRRSPARFSTTRDSPFSRTVTSFSRPQVTETVTRSPGRVETRIEHHSPLRYSPSRVHIEEVKHYSPGRVHTIRTHSPVSRAPPIRVFEEEELVKSFADLLQLEGRLEKAREDLALRPYFTVHDAFKMFDLSLYGRIGVLDIKDAFASLGIYITLEESKLIMSRYDRDHNETLRFEEFSDFFLPIDTTVGQCLIERNARYPNGYYLSPEILDQSTKDSLVYLLRLILDVELAAENIRQKHSGRPLFDRTSIFDAINRFGSSQISKQDFADFMARYKFYATEKELNSLMDRFDKSKKGSVVYTDFVDEITPHSPTRY